ncbi:MAG TPA: carboxypeptidase regulatory-like domain-containing protein [Pyrinomonadaceae bacterium]|nr:carboxypeptidase regulatory-like domain-containing protein [Pyrinomonadaceae bacterium]
MTKKIFFAFRWTALIALLLPGGWLSCWASVAHHVREDDKRKAVPQERSQESAKRLGVRLRSFIPSASASMYFEPTQAGGNVRLTVLGLPGPETLMTDGRVYVVWAVASGVHPIRVGELRTDASGNGGLEFGRPEQFERYSVIVTVEESSAVLNPTGVMVLASRAGAVTSFFGERETNTNKSRQRRMSNELARRARLQRYRNDFYAEVDGALEASGGGRTLELFGDEVTPDAHGLARVTSRERKAYVRAAVTNFPLPYTVGANTYVLWSIVPDGRIIYMGSLPTSADLNNTDIYVRVGGMATDDFDLFVTAEMRRPVSRPSGRRALSTRLPQELLGQSGGIEGRVVDVTGNPIAGALVNALYVNQPGQSKPGEAPAMARSDEFGRFFLNDLRAGTYLLYAGKEEDGYLSSFFPFFITDSGTATPRVSVFERQITQNVVLQLGAKAARLVGRILDAETTRPIERAEIMLSREDNPKNFILTGPNKAGGIFQLQVPSVPFRIKVSARGYQDWYYGSDGTREHAAPIQLIPNTTKELIVNLRPVK